MDEDQNPGTGAGSREAYRQIWGDDAPERRARVTSRARHGEQPPLEPAEEDRGASATPGIDVLESRFERESALLRSEMTGSIRRLEGHIGQMAQFIEALGLGPGHPPGGPFAALENRVRAEVEGLRTVILEGFRTVAGEVMRLEETLFLAAAGEAAESKAVNLADTLRPDLDRIATSLEAVGQGVSGAGPAGASDRLATSLDRVGEAFEGLRARIDTEVTAAARSDELNRMAIYDITSLKEAVLESLAQMGLRIERLGARVEEIAQESAW